MKNYYAAIKRETTFGVAPAVLTGAKKMRLNAFTLPELTQAQISDPEIRSDGKTSMPEFGSHSVAGTLPTALRFGENDDALEAACRSTWATDTLVAGITEYSHTVEVCETKLDSSTLILGTRFGGFRLRGAPDEAGILEFPIMGITWDLKTGVDSPFYITPTASTTRMMTCTRAAITQDGTPVLDLTAFDISTQNGLSVAKVVGSKYSPDVYTENMGLSGTLSAQRSSTVRQAAYLANTETDIVIVFSDADGNTMTFTYPTIAYAAFTLPLGNDGPPVITAPLVGGVVGTSELVQIDRAAAA